MFVTKNSSCTPVVLAGGKSSRMGRDKAFISLAGRPVIERILEGLAEVFSLPPVIITNSPAAYVELGVQTEQDLVPGKGPLSGIQAGFCHSFSPYIFVVGCDMPFLQPEFIRLMLARVQKYDAVVPESGGKVHPLHAVYSRCCAAVIEDRLAQNQYKAVTFLSQVNVFYIRPETTEMQQCAEQSLINVNTPEDFACAEAMVRCKVVRKMG